jgi:hypothetical protein
VPRRRRTSGTRRDASEIRATGTWRTNQIPLDIYHHGVEGEDGAHAASLLESPRVGPDGVGRFGKARWSWTSVWIT